MTPSILRVLSGETVWPPPVWLMRQAGRYLPEYRAVRARAGSFLDLCFSPRDAAEVTLQPIRRFGMDAAILFADILLIPLALGQGLHFAEGEGPVLPPLRNAADIDALRYDSDRLSSISETIRFVQEELPQEVPLIGFAGAPFTVSCYMIEGRGSRDFVNVRDMIYRDSSLFDALIEKIEYATIDYLCAQAIAGAQVLMLFDTWAGLLPSEMFDQYVTESTKRIISAVRIKHPDIPFIGFPRLAGLSLESYTKNTGINAVGLDTSVNIRIAKNIICKNVAIQGNIDPIILLSGGDTLNRSIKSLLIDLHDRPFIFNLGHGIVPQTPPEHVAALVQQVRTMP